MLILKKSSKGILTFPKHSKFVHMCTFIPKLTFFTFCCHCRFQIAKWGYANCWFKKKQHNPRYLTYYMARWLLYITNAIINFKFQAKNSIQNKEQKKYKHLGNIFKYIKSSSINSNKVLYGPLVFNQETEEFLSN